MVVGADDRGDDEKRSRRQSRSQGSLRRSSRQRAGKHESKFYSSQRGSQSRISNCPPRSVIAEYPARRGDDEKKCKKHQIGDRSIPAFKKALYVHACNYVKEAKNVDNGRLLFSTLKSQEHFLREFQRKIDQANTTEDLIKLSLVVMYPCGHFVMMRSIAPILEDGVWVAQDESKSLETLEDGTPLRPADGANAWHVLRKALGDIAKERGVSITLRAVTNKNDLIRLCMNPNILFDFSAFVKGTDGHLTNGRKYPGRRKNAQKKTAEEKAREDEERENKGCEEWQRQKVKRMKDLQEQLMSTNDDELYESVVGNLNPPAPPQDDTKRAHDNAYRELEAWKRNITDPLRRDNLRLWRKWNKRQLKRDELWNEYFRLIPRHRILARNRQGFHEEADRVAQLAWKVQTGENFVSDDFRFARERYNQQDDSKLLVAREMAKEEDERDPAILRKVRERAREKAQLKAQQKLLSTIHLEPSFVKYEREHPPQRSNRSQSNGSDHRRRERQSRSSSVAGSRRSISHQARSQSLPQFRRVSSRSPSIRSRSRSLSRSSRSRSR